MQQLDKPSYTHAISLTISPRFYQPYEYALCSHKQEHLQHNTRQAS